MNSSGSHLSRLSERREPLTTASRLAFLLDTGFERRCGPVLVCCLYLTSLVMVAAVSLFGLR
jgi:hypothetical protein